MLIKFNYDYWRKFQMTPFVKTLLKIIVLIISGDIKIWLDTQRLNGSFCRRMNNNNFYSQSFFKKIITYEFHHKKSIALLFYEHGRVILKHDAFILTRLITFSFSNELDLTSHKGHLTVKSLGHLANSNSKAIFF